MTDRPPPRPAADPLALDPQSLGALRREAKRALRQRLRALRLALPEGAVAARSRAATELLLALPALQRARAVALYAAIPAHRELDLGPLDAALRARGVAVYYPFLDPSDGGQHTGFRLVADLRELVPRGRPFAEPSPRAPEANPGALDVVIVPALAAAADGHRLGHGAGFYDVTLPEHCPPAVAVVVAFDFQLLAELPVEQHDVRANFVVTDARTLDVAAPAPVMAPLPAPRSPVPAGVRVVTRPR